MPKPNGFILYTGPSELDGSPIVAIVTTNSENRKTGDMSQLWILRADRSPVDALMDGSDSAICGDCVHRGDRATGSPRTCYVNVGRAPLSVYRAWKAGRYPGLDRADLVRGSSIRLGAYGDPAAVPFPSIVALLNASGTGRWTGYTHQWRSAPMLRPFVMASCDTVAEAADAAAAGWRAFLVAAVAPPAFVECPATTVGTTCKRCALCAGTSDRTERAPSIFVQPHGSGARAILERGTV
jgi:hypothetical protein